MYKVTSGTKFERNQYGMAFDECCYQKTWKTFGCVTSLSHDMNQNCTFRLHFKRQTRLFHDINSRGMSSEMLLCHVCDISAILNETFMKFMKGGGGSCRKGKRELDEGNHVFIWEERIQKVKVNEIRVFPFECNLDLVFLLLEFDVFNLFLSYQEKPDNS